MKPDEDQDHITRNGRRYRAVPARSRVSCQTEDGTWCAFVQTPRGGCNGIPCMWLLRADRRIVVFVPEDSE